MPRSNQTPPTIKDSEFLQKARDRFKYCLESWRDIREQHDLDMLFLAGDSWDEKEKQKRKRKNIPMIHLDELNQYLNQLNNDIRENKRAVKVMPIGGGATNTTAQNRSDWIRAVEYQSQAQSAYITAFEGATGGSYGFWKLETYYESPESFNLSVRICPIPNANTIVYDPDCKAYDCSDAEDCFEVEWISRDAFKRRFPGADYGGKSEFSDEIRKIAPEWISDKQVQIASWWRVKLEKVKLHLVKLPDGSTKVMREDHLPDNVTKEMILKTREHEDRRIVQYVINGVEVLETNDPSKGKGWPGKWIPIIPVWGKELFVDEGAGSERMLFSLIRLARDPQRLLNYYAAQELKEAKKTPDTPYMGPVGMFSNQAEQWESINEEGRAWVEYSTPDGYQPGSIKPERVPFVPNFQQYELAKEAARRHIMAAMGISPLPTAAQRQNEKSGIALERVEGERAQGSFHFIDNYQRSLEFSGRQLNDLFDVINDSARDIPMRKADGTHYLGRVNDSAARNNKEFKGEHEVTITTGPSHESQREEAADFADTLATVPGVFPLVGDLLVKMRNLGPIGDQLAARLIPPQFAGKDEDNPLPPEAQSAIGQLQTQIQQMQQLLQQLQQEKAAKMWEMDGKLQIEKIHSDTAKAVAEINTKAQILGERISALEALQADFHAQAHDTALSAQEHQQTMQQQSQAAALTPPATSGNTPSNGAGGTQ